MQLNRSFFATLGATLVLGVSAAAQNVPVDAKIPTYKPIEGVSGNLKSIGSDSMNNLMTYWAEGFKGVYPNVKVEIKGEGSSAAPPALIEGAAQFGPMSRMMKDAEVDSFEKKYGYKPTAVPTALDSLALFVHKDNPIQKLSLQQIDAVFSKTRKGGAEKEIVTWGDLGLTGEWATKPISLYGRNSTSGTYGFFKEHALFKGDFKDTVKEQPGSSAVVQGVASDRFALGYSGIGYATADVRAVPISVDAKSAAVQANAENVYNSTYPLARVLYVYVNHKPGSEIDPLRREFLRWILSQQGQGIVAKDGYYPITARQVESAYKALGFDTKVLEANSAK